MPRQEDGSMQRLLFLWQRCKCLVGLMVAIAVFYSTVGVASAAAAPFKGNRAEDKTQCLAIQADLAF